VAYQLAVMSQLVKSPDGQAMRMPKVLLVTLKDLDVNLNDLLVAVMFLVELSENSERTAQQLVFKAARG
jgi:hypothetical protein